jgi:hypothetical protein
MVALVSSPINKSPTSNSYIAYQVQMAREATEEVVWTANAQPGDVVAFVRNGKDVAFRTVLRIHHTTVYLGPELQVWSWGLWLDLGGAKRVRHTTRTNASQILSFLKHK